MASIDGDRDGSDGGNGLLKRVLVLGGDVGEAGVGGTNVLGLESALVVDGFVRVRVFGVNTVVLLDVLEGMIHQTTVAAHVALLARAVDQVLFGERDELLGLGEVLTFERAGGRESPARAALALILDGGDVALGAPVYTAT